MTMVGWATLYNRVGVVKRHFERAGDDPAAVESRLPVLMFPSQKVLVLVLLLFSCSFRPRPAFRIARWKTGSTNQPMEPRI